MVHELYTKRIEDLNRRYEPEGNDEAYENWMNMPPNLDLVLKIPGGASLACAFTVAIFQWLIDNEIKPRKVIVESASALVAALISEGFSPREIFAYTSGFNMNLVRSDFVEGITRRSIFSKEKLRKHLERFLVEGEKTQLNRNRDRLEINIVGVDLRLGDLILFDEGPLLDILVATEGIPYLFNGTTVEQRAVLDPALNRDGHLPTDEKILQFKLEGEESITRLIGDFVGARRAWQKPRDKQNNISNFTLPLPPANPLAFDSAIMIDIYHSVYDVLNRDFREVIEDYAHRQPN